MRHVPKESGVSDAHHSVPLRSSGLPTHPQITLFASQSAEPAYQTTHSVPIRRPHLHNHPHHSTHRADAKHGDAPDRSRFPFRLIQTPPR